VQVRYQGVDWRDNSNWGCNFERNPYGNHYIDGGSLEVMEVMFVKVKERLLAQRWAYPINAQLYDEWTQATQQVCAFGMMVMQAAACKPCCTSNVDTAFPKEAHIALASRLSTA
jgi:hypothetical protein